MRARARPRVPRRVAMGCAALAAVAPATTRAQRLAEGHGRTLLVAPAAPPTEVASRPALSLPSGRLHVAWSHAVGLALEGPPVVDAAGNVWVLASRGDAVSFDLEGAPRAHAPALGVPASGAAVLADGTLVMVNAAHEAVFVRGSEVVARTRLAGTRPAWADEGLTPLALDDGGVVVSEPEALTSLDARGAFRARGALPAALVGPLLPLPGVGILATLTSGEVYAWSASPSAAGPVRLASFGAKVDGGSLLQGRDALVALAGNSSLATLDLARGTPRVVAAALPLGYARFEGPPVATGKGLVAVLAHGLSGALTSSPPGVASSASSAGTGRGGGLALVIVDGHERESTDRDGQSTGALAGVVERGRYPVPAPPDPPPSPGGAPSAPAAPGIAPAERPPRRVPILGDPVGAVAIAFDSSRGQTLRIHHADGTSDALGELCSAPVGRGALNRPALPVVTGLALAPVPLSAMSATGAAGALVVACDNGVVSVVVGTLAP